MKRPRLIDRALRRLGLQRVGAEPRRRSIFAGAQSDRLVQDFFSGTTSPTMEIKQDLRSLRNRSRTMARDAAIAKRYCALFAENVVGEQGIQLAPRPLTAGGEIDQRLRDTILEAWREWCLPEHCTADGRYGFVELQQAIARLEPMDGEALLVLVEGAGAFGLQLQLLDPDQLDETINVEPTGSRPLIRQGVELDGLGRPVAYYLWPGHPKDSTRGANPERVPAAQVIHYYEPFRPGAARGVPRLHAAMRAANMLEGYQEAALVAARVAASAMFHEKTDDADEDAADVQVEMEPGKGWRSPGDVTMLDPKHPTTAYGDFVKSITRAIAMAGGVSYTSLSGDLEAVNYSSIRAGLLAERDFYRMQQQRMVRYVLRRVYTRWLELAQLAGRLPITAAQLRAARRAEWQPRGFPWVDPLKDLEALRLGISLGIDSRSAAAADRGRDFETVLETIAEETKLASQYQVDVSGVAPVVPTEGAAGDAQPPARSRLRIHG